MAKESNGSPEGPTRYFKEQFDDEEVLLVFRKHPIVMRKGLLLASIGLLLPMLYILLMSFIYQNNPERMPTVGAIYISLAIGLGLAFILMFPFWIGWYYSVYIFTDQRMLQITQKGLFHRSMVTVGLDQIQMVNYEVKGITETVFGFGTIVIQTFVGSLTIHDVHHPAKTQKELLHILRDLGISAGSGGEFEDQELELKEEDER